MATSLVIQVLRPADTGDDWVLIGEAEHWDRHLAISLETAQRLATALGNAAEKWG